jgi:hypothetical protein
LLRCDTITALPAALFLLISLVPKHRWQNVFPGATGALALQAEHFTVGENFRV